MPNVDVITGLTPIEPAIPRARYYTASATCTKSDLLARVAGEVLPFVVGTHEKAIGVCAQSGVDGDSVLVWDDPDTVFRVQTATGVSYAVATHDGGLYDPTGTTGIMELSLATPVLGVLKVVGHSPDGVSTEVGAHAKVAVQIQRHELASAPLDDATVFTKQVRFAEGGGYRSLTATGAVTLATTDAQYQRIDPGGSARDVTLPAEASATGLWFRIVNAADAAENLVVKDDGGSTIVTISQNEMAEVVCNGTAWVHMGIHTIALS